MDRIDQVASALEEARAAARAVGFDVDSGELQIDEDRPKVSYAFELEGLTNAPDISAIEAALEAVHGVRARIVFPKATAWITAPDTVDPDDLAAVIEGFGVRAVLTDASLRRRYMHPDPTDRPSRRPRRLPWKYRRHLEDEERSLERARRAGFLGGHEDRLRVAESAQPKDLLFTARDLLTPSRLLVCVALAVPVLLMTYFPALQFEGWQWVTLGLALPVVTWGAWPFHRAMVGGARRGLTALDAASSVAVIAATIWSVVMLLFTTAGDLGWQSHPQWFAFEHRRIADGELFLDVACGMTVLLLAGRLLTMRTRISLLDEMDEHRPAPLHPVEVVPRHKTAGGVEKLPLQEVNVGDDIVINAGELIPVDGTVVGGSCTINRGLINTGGRDLERVKVNSYVYAGSRNLDGRIKVRVVHTGHRTRLSAVHRWVRDANIKQHRSTLLSTRTAAMLIPAALGLAALDFVLWVLIAGNLNAAFATALAVLASVAPVALALSPALAIRHGIEAAVRNGILIRDGATVRQTEMIDTVVFNRVGTLAGSAMGVETVTAARGENPELILRVAGALALESDHPVSQALVRAAREARDAGAGGEDIPHWIDVAHAEIDADGNFTGLVELPAVSSDGTVTKTQVEAVLWRPRTMSDLGGRLAAAVVSGGTPLIVRWKGKDRGVISLHDAVKGDAQEAVEQLEDMGVETVMLTRDTYPVARRYADRIGVSRVLAGIAPARKPHTVRSLHTQGATVAMVGDSSVLPTLRVADIGILMGDDDETDHIALSGHDGVDIIVLRRDVSAIPQLIAQSRRVCRIIDQNIIFAWGYNAVALLASVAGVLHPMAATVLMLGSSLLIEARSNSARTFRR
ncbi:heavy metal translocating P-type ATPase [Corynebacterium marinum]|uniref:Cation-transporting P family ATPase n=1 Tax=Corynebacterium marinum DSM 44953 TaxID=1224162 RepID=A0A0B6TT72_9CORY|nr:HAD-IC family P-type ATPase [Corynebacterium marinum]AJK67946.1 cation-transporting P family ATPase [Corynebacterium marinum DSM 44953]